MTSPKIELDFFRAHSYPLIIAGPCGAESEWQVIETAIELKKLDRIGIYRAGIWKPRTRPDSFEGVGNLGLKWLARVKKLTGLWTTTEVTLPRHIDECLREGSIDIFWIGARTSVNPILVNELAAALRGTNIPVMVKNPINPDLELWIGALERFYRSGIDRLVAIHRGFSSTEASPYRNIPCWNIALELKSRWPGLPIINDPSHMAGRVDLIFELSKKSMEYGFDGLMIESHIDPASAKSDAKQQLTPKELGRLLGKLQIEGSSGAISEANHQNQRNSMT